MISSFYSCPQQELGDFLGKFPNSCCKSPFQAAKAGHLECLKLHPEWNLTRFVCTNAAEYGHLDCLIYLHQNGCNWDEWTCSAAAWGGHLECLIYIHENKCAWNADTCKFAAVNEHLECLKYAYSHGCPINKEDEEKAKKLIQEDQAIIKKALKETIQKDYNVCTDVIDEITKRIYLINNIIQ